MKTSKPINVRLLIFILGNLTAFGPFITDFYLPSLPELTKFFSSPPSLIQTSLSAGMWGLAAGQLLIGPLCDKFGRTRPLLWCLVLFIISTTGCMLAQHIGIFIGFRLLQGLTGAGGLVISKAIVADTFKAGEQTRFFAILAAIQGAAPIVAPVFGGLAFSLTTWQGAFALLGLWGIGLLVLCRNLAETLPKEERLTLPIWQTFKAYRPVLSNRQYLAMNLLQSFSSGALLSYIAASPFIFQEHFGLSPMNYGFIFAFNSLALVAGSAVVMKISRLANALKWSAIGILSAGILTACLLWARVSFILFDAALIGMLFCVGLITPIAITLALGVITANRGAASALLGAFPFTLGGIIAPLTGLGDIIQSTNILIILCVCICFALWIWTILMNKRNPA